MQVLRIVPNIRAESVEKTRRFYAELLGLETVMDHGWIATLASDESMIAQIGIASEGGSETPVPAVSIEVDDLDEALRRARLLDADIPYGPVDEPWGVRRFYVRDPDGTLLNILTHKAAG